VMPGIDSRRAPKKFSLAALGDLLTRIHSDPHVLRSARPPEKNRSQKTTRSYRLFVCFYTIPRRNVAGREGLCLIIHLV
jgi:hypothetical protein